MEKNYGVLNRMREYFFLSDINVNIIKRKGYLVKLKLFSNAYFISNFRIEKFGYCV